MKMLKHILILICLLFVTIACDDADKKTGSIVERTIYDANVSIAENEELFHLMIFDMNILSNRRNFYHWELDNLGLSMNEDSEQLCYFYDSLSSVLGPCIFEDEYFKAYAVCRGEFGGSLYFYDKETKNIHLFECVCPKMVSFIDGKYFIVEELMHMGISSSIYSIENPRELIVVPTDSSKMTTTHLWKWAKNNRESIIKSQKHAEIIISDLSLGIPLFLKMKNRSFIISSDNRFNPLLFEVINQELVLIDSLLKSNIYYLKQVPSCQTDGIYVFNSWSSRFINEGTARIYVRNDTIMIGYKDIYPRLTKESVSNGEIFPPASLDNIMQPQDCLD